MANYGIYGDGHSGEWYIAGSNAASKTLTYADNYDAATDTHSPGKLISTTYFTTYGTGNKGVRSKSIQQNIKQNNKDFSHYGLWMGGLDITDKNINQFDPLRTGFARIFITKMPIFMRKWDDYKCRNFKHIVELGFTRFDGINDTTLETEDITGGYAGNKFQVPTIVRDDTDTVTIAAYEMSGSPIREFMDTWMTGISDPLTGLSHYHGQIADSCPFKASNHTMEMFFVSTDPTGLEIEYCCMFANMMPKGVKKSHFNYESGAHPAVSVDMEFTATRYESPQINMIGAALLNKYRLLHDYLDFHSGYTTYDIENNVYDKASKTNLQGGYSNMRSFVVSDKNAKYKVTFKRPVGELNAPYTDNTRSNGANTQTKRSYRNVARNTNSEQAKKVKNTYTPAPTDASS